MQDPPFQYESAYSSITDVLSRELDNIVLLYGGSRDEQLKALGFQINRVARRIERIQNGPTLDADGNANDTIGFGYFGENGHSRDVSTPGDEVFQIESERSETIVEYGFAVEQDDVLVAVRSADNAPITGLRSGSQKRRGFGVDDLEDFGSVRSEVTRTSPDDAQEELPTTALSPTPRQGLFRIDSKRDGLNRFGFAFSNQAGAQQTISAVAVGQAYEVEPITNNEDIRSLVSPGGPPARIVTYGGFDNTNPNLPSEWFDSRVTLDTGNIPLARTRQ